MPYTAYRQFARDLVATGELDPMYTMLNRARAVKGDDWVMRFSLYMLMFYDAERAAWIADQGSQDFWAHVIHGFDDHTRGKERRHFRGANGVAGYTSLQALGSAEQAFQTPLQAKTLPDFVQALVGAKVSGFGPYFQLKWFDYATNVFDVPMDVRRLPFMLPEPPLKCLKAIMPEFTTLQAMNTIVSWISDLDDPFSGKRKCGYSEAETVACGIHTYLVKRQYSMGDDLYKYHTQLAHRPDLIRLLPGMLV